MNVLCPCLQSKLQISHTQPPSLRRELQMTPKAFLRNIILPGTRRLKSVGGPPITSDGNRMLLAIALQESGCNARYQNSPSPSPGPARGWWQFEAGGGVTGVMTHPSSKELARRICITCNIVEETNAVWRALEGHNMLACSFARLLLWTDPSPLPTTEDAGWNCYLNLWRPGAPRPDDWPGNWETATE